MRFLSHVYKMLSVIHQRELTKHSGLSSASCFTLIPRIHQTVMAPSMDGGFLLPKDRSTSASVEEATLVVSPKVVSDTYFSSSCDEIDISPD